MSSAYSIHAVIEAQKPQWLPGEDLAAVSFLAMAVLLVVEINMQIHRVFKRRTGLYFWSMQIGSVACATDAIGLLIKNFIPRSTRVWPLYTLMASVSWGIYSVAQLLVLYSRLHLVAQSLGLQRAVFLGIVMASPILILSDYVTTWAAWNPKYTMQWSVPDAIVERIVQLAFSVVEVSINVIYFVSISRLLKFKSSIRQRRVLLDLVYVNVLIVAFDILNITLVYVNRVGISRPSPAFSYALKLRLEFIVLNQLMAVAARGLKRENFEEKRYYHSGELSDWDHSPGMQQTVTGNASTGGGLSRPSNATAGVEQVPIPAPIFLNPTQHPNPLSTSQDSIQALRQKSAGVNSRWSRVKKVFESVSPRTNREDIDSEEEEIGLHQWERRGTHVMEIPWFQAAPGP